MASKRCQDCGAEGYVLLCPECQADHNAEQEAIRAWKAAGEPDSWPPEPPPELTAPAR